MPSLTDVENAFAALIVLNAPSRVIRQGTIGEGGAPSTPYVIWKMDTVTLPDFVSVSLSDTEQRIVAANTPLEFVVNMVGGTAMADMIMLTLSLRQSQRTADLYKLCGLSGVGQLTDLTGVEVGTYRQRVQARITLFTALDLVVPVELMDNVCVNVAEQQKEFDETYCMIQGECH